MKSLISIVCYMMGLSLSVCVAAAEKKTDDLQQQTQDATAADDAKTPRLHWRKDPSIKRRPASYVGGSLNYVQIHTWIDEDEDHRKLNYGPIHFISNVIRVGDAFGEKFAVGFQVQSVNAKTDEVQIAAFALLLDLSFYPWKGLGIRPSAGFGFGFAQGENKWEFGFGGPGTLSFSLLYEFRITRKMTLAPVVTGTWLTGEGYDSFFGMAGIEVLFWLPNKNQYKD